MQMKQILTALLCLGAVACSSPAPGEGAAAGEESGSQVAERSQPSVINCPWWGCGGNGPKRSGVKGEQPARVRGVTLPAGEVSSSQ